MGPRGRDAWLAGSTRIAFGSYLGVDPGVGGAGRVRPPCRKSEEARGSIPSHRLTPPNRLSPPSHASPSRLPSTHPLPTPFHPCECLDQGITHALGTVSGRAGRQDTPRREREHGRWRETKRRLPARPLIHPPPPPSQQSDAKMAAPTPPISRHADRWTGVERPYTQVRGWNGVGRGGIGGGAAR